MPALPMTIREHLMAGLRARPSPAPDLAIVVDAFGRVAKVLGRELRQASLGGRLGLTGEKNITGDAQKKLDVFANDLVVDALARTGLVRAIVSEELDDAYLPPGAEDAPYVLCVDPLDGSSNTETNGPLGTIFGIFRTPARDPLPVKRAPLPRGSDLMAAGYVLYGPGTLLVCSVGAGVDGFTLDSDIGEFLLSHASIHCPARHPNLQAYLRFLTKPDAVAPRSYSLRYSGALVADLHRCLIEGGIYFYPADGQHPDGKLRLLYECAPLAYVVEQAGGRASTGTERVLDVEGHSIHQRAPLAIGSAQELALYEAFLKHGQPSEGGSRDRTRA